MCGPLIRTIADYMCRSVLSFNRLHPSLVLLTGRSQIIYLKVSKLRYLGTGSVNPFR